MQGTIRKGWDAGRDFCTKSRFIEGNSDLGVRLAKEKLETKSLRMQCAVEEWTYCTLMQVTLIAKPDWWELNRSKIMSCRMDFFLSPPLCTNRVHTIVSANQECMHACMHKSKDINVYSSVLYCSPAETKVPDGFCALQVSQVLLCCWYVVAGGRKKFYIWGTITQIVLAAFIMGHKTASFAQQ